MSSSARSAPLAHGSPSRHPAEVIAVLDADGSAPLVARVAVEEASRRGVPVRFLEAMGAHVDAEARASTEDVLFNAGLQALKRRPSTHSVFDVVSGPVDTVVRRRSRGAVLVVVGEETTSGRTLADRCAAAAQCPVRFVAADEPHAGALAARPAVQPPEAMVQGGAA